MTTRTEIRGDGATGGPHLEPMVGTPNCSPVLAVTEVPGATGGLHLEPMVGTPNCSPVLSGGATGCGRTLALHPGPRSQPVPSAHAHALVLLLIAFACVPALFAEDLNAEQEASIIKQEAEDEAKLSMDKTPSPYLEGRVLLSGDAVDEADTVIGTFAPKGKAYQLRLGEVGVLDMLKPFNGKTARLIGKVRMQGKYFIVYGVSVPAPGPPAVDRSRRMSR